MLKDTFRKILAQPIVAGLWRPKAKAICITNYHRVYKELPCKASFNPNRPISVSTTALEAQVRYIKKRLKCLSTSEAVSFLENGGLPLNSVAVTFDDGYRDNLTEALPIFEKYQVPLTIFVVTGFLDRIATPWWDEHAFIIARLSECYLETQSASLRWKANTISEKHILAADLRVIFKVSSLEQQEKMIKQLRSQINEKFCYDKDFLSWEELRKLAQHPLVTIGSHSVNHPILTKESDAQVDYELTESKSRIERELGKECQFLAYPIGSYQHADTREFQASERAGYRAAFTSRDGIIFTKRAINKSSLPRVNIDCDYSLSTFVWRASGF